MRVIGTIDLSEIEKTMAEKCLKLDGPLDHGTWSNIKNVQLTLFESLAKRNAIPPSRLRWFTDAAYNVGSRKSRKDVFISNERAASEIPTHPHFNTVLEYFVHGARLPRDVISEFCSFWKELGTMSSGDVSATTARARNIARRHSFTHREADEVFKLAIDYGLELHHATALRKAVLVTLRA